MHKYKKFVPIVAVILLAFGVNLEKFGIDLNALSGQGSNTHIQTDSQTHSQTARQTQSQSQTQKSTHSPTSARETQTLASPTASSQSSSPTLTRREKLPHWSNTRPEINLWHVFEGEINRKGNPTGFHSRPGGQDPASARLVSIKDKPNRLGVYTANIEVRDGRQWKGKFSSFFPDKLSQQEVIDVILHAYKNSKNPNKQPWSGPSGLGFEVQGYTTSRGGINTAFPVFRRK